MTHNLCVIALVWRFCMALKVEWYQAKRSEITCFLNLNQQAHQKRQLLHCYAHFHLVQF